MRVLSFRRRQKARLVSACSVPKSASMPRRVRFITASKPIVAVLVLPNFEFEFALVILDFSELA